MHWNLRYIFFISWQHIWQAIHLSISVVVYLILDNNAILVLHLKSMFYNCNCPRQGSHGQLQIVRRRLMVIVVYCCSFCPYFLQKQVSSSNAHLKSQFVEMGFSPTLVDKVIQENGGLALLNFFKVLDIQISFNFFIQQFSLCC